MVRNPTTFPTPTHKAHEVFACLHCDGTGVENDEELPIPCLCCNGTGYGAVWFALNQTRSHDCRSAEYETSTRILTLRQGKEEGIYLVREFPADGGRGFYLIKPDGERYEIFLGRGNTTQAKVCPCMGSESTASAKANQRAFDRGKRVYPTWGCWHLDAMVPLLAAGWLDIGKEAKDVG